MAQIGISLPKFPVYKGFSQSKAAKTESFGWPCHLVVTSNLPWDIGAPCCPSFGKEPSFFSMAEIGIPTPGVQHLKIVPTQKLSLQKGLAGLGLLRAGSHLLSKHRVCVSMERNQRCSPGKKGQNWDSTLKILYIKRFHPEQPWQDRKLCLALASGDYSSSAPETLGLCGFLPVETIVTLWGLLK